MYTTTINMRAPSTRCAAYLRIPQSQSSRVSSLPNSFPAPSTAPAAVAAAALCAVLPEQMGGALGPVTSVSAQAVGRMQLVLLTHEHTGAVVWDLNSQALVARVAPGGGSSEPGATAPPRGAAADASSRITTACWTTHRRGDFATGHEDGDVMVWQLPDQRGGQCSPLCCVRIGQQPNAPVRSMKFVITGGLDSLLVCGGQAAEEPDVLSLLTLPRAGGGALVSGAAAAVAAGVRQKLPWFGPIKDFALVSGSGAILGAEDAAGVVELLEGGQLAFHDIPKEAPTMMAFPFQSCAAITYGHLADVPSATGGDPLRISMAALRAAARSRGSAEHLSSYHTHCYQDAGLQWVLQGGHPPPALPAPPQGSTTCPLYLTGHSDGRVCLWDVAHDVPSLLAVVPQQHLYDKLRGASKPVTALLLSTAQHGLLATGHENGQVRAYRWVADPTGPAPAALAGATTITGRLGSNSLSIDTLPPPGPGAEPGLQLLLHAAVLESEITALAYDTSRQTLLVADKQGSLVCMALAAARAALLWQCSPFGANQPVRCVLPCVVPIAKPAEPAPGASGGGAGGGGDRESASALFVASAEACVTVLEADGGQPLGRHGPMTPKAKDSCVLLELLGLSGLPLWMCSSSSGGAPRAAAAAVVSQPEQQQAPVSPTGGAAAALDPVSAGPMAETSTVYVAPTAAVTSSGWGADDSTTNDEASEDGRARRGSAGGAASDGGEGRAPSGRDNEGQPPAAAASGRGGSQGEGADDDFDMDAYLAAAAQQVQAEERRSKIGKVLPIGGLLSKGKATKEAIVSRMARTRTSSHGGSAEASDMPAVAGGGSSGGAVAAVAGSAPSFTAPGGGGGDVYRRRATNEAQHHDDVDASAAAAASAVGSSGGDALLGDGGGGGYSGEAAYLLMVDSQALRLYSVSNVLTANRGTIKKVKPENGTIVFASTFQMSGSPGVVVLTAGDGPGGSGGDLQVYSLPNLGLVLDVPLDSAVRSEWTWEGSLLAQVRLLAGSHSGQLALVGPGNELLRLSLAPRRDDWGEPGSAAVGQLYDWDLAAAAHAASMASEQMLGAGSGAAATAAGSSRTASAAGAPPAAFSAAAPLANVFNLVQHGVSKAIDETTRGIGKLAHMTGAGAAAAAGNSNGSPTAGARVARGELSVLFNTRVPEPGVTQDFDEDDDVGLVDPEVDAIDEEEEEERDNGAAARLAQYEAARRPQQQPLASSPDRVSGGGAAGFLSSVAAAVRRESSRMSGGGAPPPPEPAAKPVAEPVARTADEIKAKYGRPPKPGAGSGGAVAGPAGVQGRVSNVAGVMSEVRDKAIERGEKLAALNEKAADMEDAAMDFAEMARRIADREKNKKWWQL